MTLYQSVLFYFRYIWYEITYYILGARAVIDDLASKGSNVCPLIEADGCVALVTGGARGIGSALVKKLLMCNMTVIIACRNKKAGEGTVRKFREEGISSGHAFVYHLDLMSFTSITEFVNTIRSNHKEIHLLVNNAGIMFAPYQETDEGFESQWGVNFLGPVLLTHLLFPLLEKSTLQSSKISARVVNVSSCAHIAAKPIDFENMNDRDNYIPSLAYAQSKLAQILFTAELNRRLDMAGSKVTSFCVHPGIVNTDLFEGTLLKKCMPWVLTNLCKDVDEGASSVYFACVSPKGEGFGGFYSSNCEYTQPGQLALSVDLQKALYDHTLKTLNITDFGKSLP